MAGRDVSGVPWSGGMCPECGSREACVRSAMVGRDVSGVPWQGGMCPECHGREAYDHRGSMMIFVMLLHAHSAVFLVFSFLVFVSFLYPRADW